MAQRFESKGYSHPMGLSRSLRKYNPRIITFLCSPMPGNPQNFYEEAVAWKHLEHPNIVPLLGITIAPSPPQLISDWISGGNLTNYIGDHPGADRLGLVDAPVALDNRRAHHFQGVQHRQWPRIPPL